MRNKNIAELTIASGQFRQEEAYWLERMKGDLPKSGFTRDFWNSDGNDLTKSEQEFCVPRDVFERILGITGENDARIHVVLATAMAALLFRYNDEPDVLFGVPVYVQEKKSSVDLLNTALPIRVFVGGQWSFKELLMELRRTIVAAMDHANYPIETLLYQLELSSDGKDFPLFDVAILLENIHRKEDISYLNPGLLFRFRRVDRECVAIIEYRAENYHSDSIRLIFQLFVQVLSRGIRDVECIVADLPLWEADEKERLLDNLNGEHLDFPGDMTLPVCFLNQMGKTPDYVAIVDDDKQLTYLQLGLKASGIAGSLNRNGVRVGELVPVILDRSGELAATMLGIVMAGGAYLPIDPKNRQARITFILRDSAGRFVFAPSGFFDMCHKVDEGFQVLDPAEIADASHIAFQKDDARHSGIPLYAIYTSGSTGLPKGVLVHHRGIINLVYSHRHIFGNTCFDRFSQVASSGFDAMAFETWPALLGGASLYIAAERLVMDPHSMMLWLLSRRITITFQSTRMAELLLTQTWPYEYVPLRMMRTAGDTLKAFPPRGCPFLVYNLYGPTEDTIWTTWLLVPGENTGHPGKPSIGKPVPNKRVFVVGKDHRLQPIGVPGELYIAGEGLALGYLNRPGLTAEKFNALSGDIGNTVYKTGDMVRCRPDGNLEFLGRVDNQVKIRGYRIEPGEIESHLMRIEGITGAVVLPVENPGLEKHLCAYVVSDPQLENEEIKSRLAQWLPDYMIPALFVHLDALPINSSGKVNRNALPKPDWTGQKHYAAPRNHLERMLVGLWSEVLHLDKASIGIDANFLDLGGHSISATVLAANIRKHFNVSMPLARIFEKPSVRAMAAFISGQEPEDIGFLESVEKMEYYQLSSAQNRLYIMQMMDEDNSVYNVPGFIKLAGRLDFDRLREAFERLLERHESLRTYFAWIDNQPVQLVAPSAPFEIERIDARGRCEDELIRDFIKSFDLKRPPLMRVSLASIGEDRYLLMVDLHHIISDGISLAILVRDFMDLYSGKRLSPLKYHYRDFAHWQRALYSSKKLEAQERFWVELYEGWEPYLDFPTDLPYPAARKYTGEVVRHSFPLDFGEKVYRFLQENDATLYMLLMAVYNIVLAKLCRREDIVVGSPVTGRTHADIQDIVGMFVNMLSIRNRPHAGKTFRNFLSEVKDNALDAFENQDYQFVDLVKTLGIVRENNRNPLFNVVFQLDDLGVQTLKIGDLDVDYYDVQEEACQFDLILAAFTDGKKIRLNLTYATELFRRSTAEKILTWLDEILRQVVDFPEKLIGEFILWHGGLEVSTTLTEDAGSDFGF